MDIKELKQKIAECEANGTTTLDLSASNIGDDGAEFLAQNTTLTTLKPFTEPRVPAPESLSPDRLSEILDMADFVDMWIGAVRAHAKNIVEAGEVVPGYKMVRKNAHRKWLDDKEVVKLAEKYIAKEKLYTEPKLRSPAQIEKLSKHPIFQQELTSLIVKPEGALTLVKETDKRQAITTGVSAYLSK